VRRSWLRLFLLGVIVVGVIAAYLVSTGLGERLLHREIETQLSRLLMGPVEIAEVEVRFADGLRIEARGLEAYPNPDPTAQPALRAGRVLAWVDLLALLVGRLELSTLILDGPHLRIEEASDGSLLHLPFPPIPSGLESDNVVSLAERITRQLYSMPTEARALIERFRVADRIEIHDGTVHWIDHGRLTADGRAQELRLELVSGMANRDWLSKAVVSRWHAVFVDGEHVPFPVEVEIKSDESPHFEWTASLSQIPLEAVEASLDFIEPIEGLSGSLDARFHFATSDTGSHKLSFEGLVENATVYLRQTESIIEQKRIEIRADLTLDDKSLRISEGSVNGQRLGIDFKGAIDRPIRPDSLTHIESRMVGVRIKGLRELIRRFEEQSDTAAAVLLLTERIESGHIRYVQIAGTARLRHWQDLAQDRTRDLPDRFLLRTALEEISIGSEGSESDSLIEDLKGELEWAGDQRSLRNMNAIYHGRPLPEINLEVDGISHLIRASDSDRTMTANPPRIPGVTPLIEIFKPRDPDALPPIKAAGVVFDRFEHPLFRWPIRNAHVLVEPRRGGMQLSIREGTWGGTAVKGDLLWLNDSDSPSIRAQIALSAPPTPPIDSAASASEPSVSSSSSSTGASAPNPDRWGSGRFELEFRPRPRLPFRRATGFFRIEGANLIGNEVEIELESTGQAALRTNIGLQDPESIDLDLSFAITEASFEGMSEFIVLPPDLVRGDVGATGSLAGLVRPDTSFIAELDGRVRVEAKNGRVETSLPLLLRLGKASEGYNPFANEAELEYESMTGTLEL